MCARTCVRTCMCMRVCTRTCSCACACSCARTRRGRGARAVGRAGIGDDGWRMLKAVGGGGSAAAAAVAGDADSSARLPARCRPPAPAPRALLQACTPAALVEHLDAELAERRDDAPTLVGRTPGRRTRCRRSQTRTTGAAMTACSVSATRSTPTLRGCLSVCLSVCLSLAPPLRIFLPE